MSESGPGTHETIDGDPARSASAGSGPAIGHSLGRYVILGRLGAGAMGVVYAAWDPELDRRVAIKVLHPSVRPGSEGRSRLLREAQALAKLSHPNVVTVHDVGTVDDRIWIAMEFVEGITLDAWLRAAVRRWQDVLDVLVEAGRGLAAAHAAGVVHRDFKPENVMVSGEAPHARVRVMDFGLARAEQLKPAQALESATGIGVDTSRPERELSVTRTGAMLGTPAYMAPEQHSRLPADIRSDQFSYCVSLWQALYRERPYAGETAVELAANVIAGRIRPPPPRVRVPAWLRRAVVRGLAGDPDARWPTIDVLLAEIARGRARRRLRRPLLFVAALALIAATGVGIQQLRARSRIDACDREGQALASVWNDDARVRVQQVVSSAALPDAALSADRIVDTTDREVALWAEVRTETCVARRVEERWDNETYERSLWCLELRRLELETFLAGLHDRDPAHLRAAVEAANRDYEIARCGDAELLAYAPRPPPELRDEVLRRLELLLRITVLLGDDTYATSLTAAQAELERNETLGWAPLVAESRLRVGELLWRVGRFEEAERMLEDCYFEASRVDALETAASAATSLVYTVGARLARFREGLRWSREAELVLAKLGDEDGRSKAVLLSYRAAVEFRLADYDAARASVEQALAIRERLLVPDHPDTAESLGHLANIEAAAGHHERARTLLRRSLAIKEVALGPGHPHVAIDLINLGDAERALGDLDEAEKLLRRGIEIQRAELGPTHPDIATSLNNLAAIYNAREDRKGALDLVEQSMEIKRVSLGPDHPEVGLGLFNMATLTFQLGELEPARGLAEQALAVYEASVGPDYREVGFVIHLLGTIALQQDRSADAARLFEREVGIIEGSTAERVALADARFMLARSLWSAPSSRTRALELARSARDDLRAEKLPTTHVEEWLGAHDQ